MLGRVCPWCSKVYDGLLALHICPDGSTFDDRCRKTAKDYANREETLLNGQPAAKPEDKAIVHVPNPYNKLRLTKFDIDFLKLNKVKIDSDCIEVK